MAGSGENGGPSDSHVGYEPTRAARLRPRGSEPPPLPPAPTVGHGFGSADEDGLRMLAALETLTSLEPDYSDDLAAEASVTIIDAAGHEVVAAAFAAEPTDERTFRRLLGAPAPKPAPDLLLNGYENFLAPGDEAIVEIVEIAPAFDDVAEAPARSSSAPSASLTERLAAAAGPGGRFLKALSGG